MSLTLTITGASIGLALALIYVIVAFRVHKTKPELSRIIVIIMSILGITTV